MGFAGMTVTQVNLSSQKRGNGSSNLPIRTSKFILNDLVGIVRKRRLNIDSVDPILVGFLMQLESKGIIGRAKTRQIIEQSIDEGFSIELLDY